MRVERVVAVQDCGRPINPLLVESQVQGGVLMGLSYALFEERILDQHTGRMVNPNLEQYKLAGPRETPAIEVVLLENYQGRSATDAYGIAEPSNIATAAGDRQRRLQRDRRSPARPADDAGGGSGGARQDSGEELTHEPLRPGARQIGRRGGDGGDDGGRRRHAAGRPTTPRSSRRAASTSSIS